MKKKSTGCSATNPPTDLSLLGRYVVEQATKKAMGGVAMNNQKEIKNMRGKGPPPIKPGEKAPESGIYKDTKSTQRTTLDHSEKAPPTPEKGGKWKLEVPTNPRKR